MKLLNKKQKKARISHKVRLTCLEKRRDHRHCAETKEIHSLCFEKSESQIRHCPEHSSEIYK